MIETILWLIFVVLGLINLGILAVAYELSKIRQELEYKQWPT